MEPGQFLQLLSQGNQMQAIVGEVTRNKALALALGQAEVVDADGNAVDLSTFTQVDSGEEDAEEASEGTAEDENESEEKVCRVKTLAALPIRNRPGSVPDGFFILALQLPLCQGRTRGVNRVKVR